MHINYANADEIADSLKISHELAEQIVSVREQIGGYSTLEEPVSCRFDDSEYHAANNGSYRNKLIRVQ